MNGVTVQLDRSRTRSPAPAGRGRNRGRRLAVLVSPQEVVSPSSLSSLRHFETVARRHGVDAELLGGDPGQLAHYDGLFIRQTTALGNAAHRWSERALALGMPVIDDPASILIGCDKLRQHEMFSRAGIAQPRTRVVRSQHAVLLAVEALGMPLVLKIRDGSYCRGVEKADSIAEALPIAAHLTAFAGPILAQEYVPTSFDWRIGTLAGEPLFACKYHMVSGHWQVIARGAKGALQNGSVEPVALADVPPEVLALAERASRCAGRGLYGIDIKVTSRGPLVLEVNDNPDMDFDVETLANPEAWGRLADWFLATMSASRDAPRVAETA